ncbi:hypothetical protein EV207_12512 [Scopulibacillus darangshiensis]|uniref:Uncharacterized protein n=1 Tax=Scopulibacillus darangshiensis TaxID=442528 RepID=A0A4R2NRT1_9BACL|nr:hypothetical protein [Scopulibacillus darangshiensis]TCP24452.1 hypothetical protein EV207_12512 [Scopulibacillus darangshiensis]
MVKMNIDSKHFVLDWMSSGSFIPVNKHTAHRIGLNKAVLLAEAVNQYRRWYTDGKLDDQGMFFWTEEDCEEQTTFSKATQSRLFKALEDEGFLKRHKRQIKSNDKLKTTRYLEMFFDEIVNVLFSDDEAKEQRLKYYEERKQKNKVYSTKYKNENRKSQNETSRENTDMTGKSQNETSSSLDMKLPQVSNRDTSNNISFNKNKDILKTNNNKNLSIQIENEIMDLNVTPSLKKSLIKKIDRLILFKINVLDIETKYKTSGLSDYDFENVLTNVLNSEVKSNFRNMLQVSIDTYIENKRKKTEGITSNQHIDQRRDKLPKWLQKDMGREKEQQEEKLSASEERWLNDYLKWDNEDSKKENDSNIMSSEEARAKEKWLTDYLNNW